MSKEIDAAREVLILTHAWEDMIGTDPEAPTISALADLLGGATLHAGLCELYAKKSERGEALAQGKARATHYSKLSKRHHERELAILRDATEAASDFASEADNVRLCKSDDAAAAIADFSEEFFEYLSEGELKVADMHKLRAVFDDVTGRMLKSESPGDEIAKLVREAYEARSSDDRGLRDNLPWWKIALIAAYLGVTVWKIWRCTIRKRCSRATKEALEAAALILGVSLKYC